jgi:hypothetical protein
VKLTVDQGTQIELEAAAFRSLVEHLRDRSDVQNIDLMNLAGFCRNCLAKWYQAAAEQHGEAVDYERAREYIYGMTYGEWKAKYQTEASAEQLAAFEASKPKHAF